MRDSKVIVGRRGQEDGRARDEEMMVQVVEGREREDRRAFVLIYTFHT